MRVPVRRPIRNMQILPGAAAAPSASVLLQRALHLHSFRESEVFGWTVT